jgi:hypothetical protein
MQRVYVQDKTLSEGKKYRTKPNEGKNLPLLYIHRTKPSKRGKTCLSVNGSPSP